jgi:6-pyruvoyltetrahydropterin/6-carboxytetrahydropterin synthase
MTVRTMSVTKVFTFDAAHRLPDYDGKCARVHGHTYKLEVTAACQPLDLVDGMAIDFAVMSRIVQAEILDRVDHAYLNNVFEYAPTAENMAADFLCTLGSAIEKQPGLAGRVRISSVRLWETPTSFAECCA